MNNLPNPRGIVIENNHDYDGINLRDALNIGSPEQFLKVCEKTGFELARIRSINDLELQAFLALE